MMKILDRAEVSLEEILRREDTQAGETIEKAVADILENVKARGDAAVLDYGERFDRVRPASLRVTPEEIDAAVASQDADFLETLEQAAANIREYHALQKRTNFVHTRDGVVMGQKITPIERVGIYVPGGTASYPSSVLMNAIPAQIAGVSEIIMVTPPAKDGGIAPAILAAAKVAGVTAIYKTGGAQAVGALAYGTESIPKVDKIVGPGNIYVATAKRRVYGLVDIDMIAGPSEILVLADAEADPVCVAADLLSQAEHDRMASAVLVCDSRALAEAVAAEVEAQLKTLPREDIARASIETNGKIIVAADISEGIDIANAIAPEHLELCVADPFDMLTRVKNAGSIFLGRSAPEALGDYFAGPNHTLPTLGTARFSSPLSVDDFVKKSSFLYYTREALEQVHTRIESFAHREGLDGHARSIAVRFDREAVK